MEKYVCPEMEIIEIDDRDVIATSNGNTGSFDGEWAPIPW